MGSLASALARALPTYCPADILGAACPYADEDCIEYTTSAGALSCWRELETTMSEPIRTMDFQAEQELWVRRNFPGRTCFHPLLGLQEEVGELAHHVLKRDQGIRLEEDHDAGIRDAVADIFIYLADFCTAEELDLGECITETWAKVRQRDWVAHRAEHAEGESDGK